MGAIYSTYAVLEVGIKPRLLKSRMNLVNCGSTSLIMSAASITREFKTLLNMVKGANMARGGVNSLFKNSTNSLEQIVSK